jgi:proton-dependent oligopeptide transporter, POT family
MERNHPKGLYTLFFTEMWERFSYYGMRALLILYMTRQILYGDTEAYGIYAAYGALVYATPFLGGVIADQILGYRRSIILGAVLMAIGHFLMAFESELFFFSALSFLIIGNGFFKPNISSMVGGLYKPGDSRRDGGFTIFYMGINLGAFLSPLACGLLGELLGWHYGFGLAGVGMVIGLIVFVRGQRHFDKSNGAPPKPENLNKVVFAGISREVLVYVLTFLVVPVIGLLIWNYHLMTWFLTPFAVVVFFGLLVMSFTFQKVERQRIWVILILAFFSIAFWAFFEQAGSSITLFTANNVDRFVFGFEIPTSVFQSVNPLFIIIFAPIFAALWVALAKKNKEPNTTVKFALGLIQLGLGFGVFVLGAAFAGDNGMVAIWFLVFGYLLHTTGELCISPVGLSMVTKLAPARLVGMVMGAWFLSFSMAQHLGGVVAKYTSTARFMETGVTYEPFGGFTGNDQLTVRAYCISDQDTLFSDPLTLNISVTDEPQKVDQTSGSTFYYHRAVKPGETIGVNLRVPYLDPTGKLTRLNVDTNTSFGDVRIESDSLFYTASLTDTLLITGVMLSDTIYYNMVEQDNSSNSDRVGLVVSVSSDEVAVFSPVLLNDQKKVAVRNATTLRKSFNTINVLDNFYVPSGAMPGLEILEEPVSGYAKTGNMLNPFVGPTKTIHIYSTVFYYLFIISIIVGVIVFLLTPVLRKWMHGEH